MNREILFRAKRIDNGGWVYGHYAIIGKRDVIIKTENEEFYSVDEDLKKKSGNEVIEIQKDTICEYMGLQGKNGKKIFEGDIIKHDMSNTIGAVKWYRKIYIGWYVDDICMGNQQFLDYMWEECEVIGNIFDNPELLELEEYND